MNIYRKIALNIKRYRKLKHMTQKQLAESIGYSYEYIRRIEAPKYAGGFTIELVYLVSVALDIDIALLFQEPV